MQVPISDSECSLWDVRAWLLAAITMSTTGTEAGTNLQLVMFFVRLEGLAGSSNNSINYEY